MKNYAVLEGLIREAKGCLNNAFDKGYKQGHQSNEETIEYEVARRVSEEMEKEYKRGREDGLALNRSEVNAAEACGMRRAWNAARKIVDLCSELTQEELGEIFGSFDVNDILNGLSASEAVEKIEAWEKKQDAPEINVGSIEVGDVVRMIGSDPKLDNCDYGICTMVKPKTIYVMRMDGSVGEEDKEEWKKTDNHYNIKDILDKMKEHDEK